MDLTLQVGNPATTVLNSVALKNETEIEIAGRLFSKPMASNEREQQLLKCEQNNIFLLGGVVMPRPQAIGSHVGLVFPFSG